MDSTRGGFVLWPISRWRIGFKLTLFFLVLAIVPILLVTSFVNNFSRNALLNQGGLNLRSEAQSTAEKIDAELAKQREFIGVVGILPELVRYVQAPNDAAAKDLAQRVLTAAVEKSADYDSIAIINAQGKVILASSAADVGTDLQFRLYFIEAMKGSSYISDPSVSVITNQPAIFYSGPIKNDAGNVLGVVRSRMTLNPIWTSVEQDYGVAGDGSFGILLDENGIRLADSSSKINRQIVQDTLLYRAVAPIPLQIEKTLVDEQRFGKASFERVQVVPLPDIASRLKSGETKAFETHLDVGAGFNEAVIIPLSNKPWRYVLTTPETAFTGPADALVSLTYLIAGAVAIIAIGAAFLISRTITLPLAQLVKVADRISLGELDARIDIKSQDEIGELADAVGRMQASLQAAIERLRARRPSVQ